MGIDSAKDNQLEAQLVVASDVHLESSEDPRCSLLIDVLDRLSDSVEYFVLNGDIFDFCFGESAYFREKFRHFGEALRRAVQRGIKVIFVEGNHEFHLESMGWKYIQIVTNESIIIRLQTGELVKIGHGDLIVNEPFYRAFRAILKSRIVKKIAAKVPGSFLDFYALHHARISRSRNYQRSVSHEVVLKAAEEWVKLDSCEHGIFGHFHIPFAEKSSINKGFIMSVESWENPNLLIYNNGSFSRIYLKEPSSPFQYTGCFSVLSE